MFHLALALKLFREGGTAFTMAPPGIPHPWRQGDLPRVLQIHTTVSHAGTGGICVMHESETGLTKQKEMILFCMGEAKGRVPEKMSMTSEASK